MPEFLAPDMTGLYPFTASGLAFGLTLILLLCAVHPLALLAGRAGSALRPKATPTAVDGGAANALGSGSLFFGEIVVPGYLIFALGLWSYLTVPGRSVFTWLEMTGTSGPDLRLTALLALGAFALTGVVDNIRPAWTRLLWSKAAAALNCVAMLAVAIGFVQSGFSVEWVLGVTSLAFLLRLALAFLARGALLYGFGALFYAPIMACALLLVTIAIAYLGPLFMLVRRAVETPRAGGKISGLARAQVLSSKLGDLPSNHTLDSLDGMLKPR